MNKLLGLKIDVDTYWGMKKGVPVLLRVLDEFDLKGTFYLSIGPDASGRAVLQLFRNPLFLKKMVRTNAVGLYGIRTSLYGTLLPSPMIALSFPELVKEITARGHEVQFHAWDHRRWQDELPRRSAQWIQDWFARGVEGFQRLTGRRPSSFGAPAWLIDDRVLEVLKDYDLDYLSCTRAQAPFIHSGPGIVEIPSDLPCPEEAGMEGFADVISACLQEGGLHVLPVHAEMEGGPGEVLFRSVLDRALEEGYAVRTLGAIAKTLPREDLPVRKHQMSLLPGRAVPCAV